MSSREFPPVTPHLLSEATRRIRSVANARLIVLFGSRARGDHRPDSDLDILVVAESDLPRWKRAAPIRRALAGLFPAKDIIVYTPEEVAEWQNVPNAFITTILKEGRILYREGQERPHAGMDS
ncbi:MAG: nucleotidyltransferase domain-containing protein [Bacillota bacterium]|nr:nucleotidyltransferase domain-containing protein [Bacillota bacterium]